MPTAWMFCRSFAGVQMDQKAIWESHGSTISVADIVRQFHRPADFQRCLASLIDRLCAANDYKRVIEVGCESGITTMLLNDKLEKTFLDFNRGIIDKVGEALAQLGKTGTLVVEDMHHMSAAAEQYDVVFNSGVIEHYHARERTELLREYARVLQPEGALIIGVPNHYSLPYRSAYVVKKVLLRGFRWPWPAEYKIYDLARDIEAAGLRLVARLTCDRRSCYGFWNFAPPIKRLFKWSDSFMHYEGYLTVLVITKRHSSLNDSGLAVNDL